MEVKFFPQTLLEIWNWKDVQPITTIFGRQNKEMVEISLKHHN
jgi:hypothetical protein